MITSLAMPGPETLLIVLLFLPLYFLPTIIAVVRKAPNLVAVILVNLLFGWSFIGWIVALVMSLRSTPKPQIVQSFGTQPGPSPQSGGSTPAWPPAPPPEDEQ
jgi:hypothetical protein